MPTPDSDPARPTDTEKPSPKAGDDDTAGGSGGWAAWTSAGFEFGAAVFLFFLLGSKLDATWGTPPWMTVAGVAIGVSAGTYLLIRQANRSERNGSSNRPKPPSDSPPPRD